jgi:hypothetical protein
VVSATADLVYEPEPDHDGDGTKHDLHPSPNAVWSIWTTSTDAATT